MATSFFETQLLALAFSCGCSLLLERFASTRKRSTAEGRLPSTVSDRRETQNGSATPGWKADGASDKKSAASRLSWKYLPVYGVVMAADWLQGPYVYSLYREEYVFEERTVATLFVTGFLSAGLFAPLVGSWADQHGRRRLVLAFCVAYASACFCILVSFLPVLFLGRILGGFSTSILFSVFESWLISSANSTVVAQSDLSSIMGHATTLNGFVAALAGVTANKLVETSGTFTAPFIASAALLGLAWIMIRGRWNENYGAGGGTDGAAGDPFQIKRLRIAWQIVRADSSLLTLGLTQTCFEGSMYLFVFLWVPSLQELSLQTDLPLGYIFSSFMVSMMLGSLVYTSVIGYPPLSSNQADVDAPLVVHAKLSSLVCTLSSLALALSIGTSDLRIRFWAFCLFEACVGIYYPVQGMLRGALIPNDHRATLSSLFRVPLNIFVLVALMTGVSSARRIVMGCSSISLALSAITTAWVVLPRAVDHSVSDHTRVA